MRIERGGHLKKKQTVYVAKSHSHKSPPFPFLLLYISYHNYTHACPGLKKSVQTSPWSLFFSINPSHVETNDEAEEIHEEEGVALFFFFVFPPKFYLFFHLFYFFRIPHLHTTHTQNTLESWTRVHCAALSSTRARRSWHAVRVCTCTFIPRFPPSISFFFASSAPADPIPSLFVRPSLFTTPQPDSTKTVSLVTWRLLRCAPCVRLQSRLMLWPLQARLQWRRR